MFNLEEQIAKWRDHLLKHGSLSRDNANELESHLRDLVAELCRSGLSGDEAFLISIKRLGNTNSISREYAKVYTERLWKQLMIFPGAEQEKRRTRTELLIVILLSLLAGTFAKIPALLGYDLWAGDEIIYLKNASLFVFPLLSAYFIWKHTLTFAASLIVLAPFLVALLAVNLYPFTDPGQTELLAALHLPIFLWLFVGFSYVGGQHHGNWKDAGRRMGFVSFSGETFLYSVLIACGVCVLLIFTQQTFSAIGIDASSFSREYLFIFLGAATPIVAAYLVEVKKSVVENLAPVLAKIFSPLFLLTMLVFLGTMLVTGRSPFSNRETLIAFDIMLALVIGLVLYIISARDDSAPPAFFDYINTAMILVALVIDLIALSAIIGRINSFGFSPNKSTALGENIVLLFNLGGLAFFYVRFILGKRDLKQLVLVQTRYLPIYSLWSACVVFLFPLIFGFH